MEDWWICLLIYCLARDLHALRLSASADFGTRPGNFGTRPDFLALDQAILALDQEMLALDQEIHGKT